MNKLLLIQIGVISIGIICIFTCFFLTITEYHPAKSDTYVYIKFDLSSQIKVGSNTIDGGNVGSCSTAGEDPAATNECMSWKWNFAMGILVIISGSLVLILIILREFTSCLSECISQVRLTIYAISVLSFIFALIGLIWLLATQQTYVVQVPPMCLMTVAGVLIMIGGFVLELFIQKEKQR